MSEAPKDCAATTAAASAEDASFDAPVRLKPESADSATENGVDDDGVTELKPDWLADPVASNVESHDETASSGEPNSSAWPPVPPLGQETPHPAGGNGGGDVPAAGAALVAPDAGGGNEGSEDQSESNKGEHDPGSEAEKPMTLMDHLGELRTRLTRILIGAFVGFLLCYGAAEQLFLWLAQPLASVMPQDTRLIYTSIPEGFFVYLKVAFVAGMFLASPYIFYQVWAFVAPGLYKEERRQMLPLSLCSAVFFISGASFCYYVVFPYAFTFFMSYSTGMIVAMPSINEYLGFSLKMLIAFGLIFEMPLFAFFLARMGVITAAWMRKVRRYAVLVVFVVAAVLTPPDVFSQMLMAIPMILLYEVSILVAATVGRKEKTAGPSDTNADASAGDAA